MEYHYLTNTVHVSGTNTYDTSHRGCIVNVTINSEEGYQHTNVEGNIGCAEGSDVVSCDQQQPNAEEIIGSVDGGNSSVNGSETGIITQKKRKYQHGTAITRSGRN